MTNIEDVINEYASFEEFQRAVRAVREQQTIKPVLDGIAGAGEVRVSDWAVVKASLAADLPLNKDLAVRTIVSRLANKVHGEDSMGMFELFMALLYVLGKSY